MDLSVLELELQSEDLKDLVLVPFLLLDDLALMAVFWILVVLAMCHAGLDLPFHSLHVDC